MKEKVFKLAKDLNKISDKVFKMDDAEIREHLKFFGAKMGRGRSAFLSRKLSLISHLKNTHARVY